MQDHFRRPARRQASARRCTAAIGGLCGKGHRLGVRHDDLSNDVRILAGAAEAGVRRFRTLTEAAPGEAPQKGSY
jgi:hypothetical protein